MCNLVQSQVVSSGLKWLEQNKYLAANNKATTRITTVVIDYS